MAGDGAGAREERLRAALLANMGRRKAQGRARAADRRDEAAAGEAASAERKDEADG